MWNENQSQTESYTLPFRVISLTHDPYNRILRKGYFTGIGESEGPASDEYTPTAFPNPAGSTLCIDWPHHGDFTVTVYDIAGRCVQQREISITNPLLDVSELPSGCYVYRTTTSVAVNSGTFTILRN